VNLEGILSRLGRDLLALLREATEIRVRLAIPAEPKFYMSLYALIMGAFSQVDLLATLGAETEPQRDGLRGS